MSREQRLRQLTGLAGDGIPGLTGADRAEARCWGVHFSELDMADLEFIPGRAAKSGLKSALYFLICEIRGYP